MYGSSPYSGNFSGNSLTSMISALTPITNMGLSAYASIYGMNSYYKSYGNYLSSCQTIGIACGFNPYSSYSGASGSNAYNLSRGVFGNSVSKTF